MNEIIIDKKDIIDEIFQNYLKYQNPSFLAKELLRAKRVKRAKNEQLVNNIYVDLINLRKVSVKKETPENENPNKIEDT